MGRKSNVMLRKLVLIIKANTNQNTNNLRALDNLFSIGVKFFRCEKQGATVASCAFVIYRIGESKHTFHVFHDLVQSSFRGGLCREKCP